MLAGPSADPDVERLLEGVAFLTGLTRQKLDDEFPEFIQELANLLFPHYLRPIPASTLIQFSPKGTLGAAVNIPTATALNSLPVDDTPCQFRTTSDLEVQPLVLLGAKLVNQAGAGSTLTMEFELQGVEVARWQADSIRLFLSAGYADAVNTLLLLSNHVKGVRVSVPGGVSFELGTQCLRNSGFEQTLLPYVGNAFSGFRGIQEYFVFPEKFLYVDVTGLSRWKSRGEGYRFKVQMALGEIPEWMPEIGEHSFLLNVVPAINLFSHTAIPIHHAHRASEYRLIPEGRDQKHYQVYAVDRVTGYQQGMATERVYSPFGLHRPDQSGALSYRTSLRKAVVGRGDDVFLSVSYPRGHVPLPETLSVELTCTNRSLPERLQLGDICSPTSTSPERMNFRNIRPVTGTQNPPAGEALLWRMLSHVSLNVLSIASAEHLKETLSLYLFSERREGGGELANRRRIEGIQDVVLTRETRLVGRASILHGQRVRIRCCSDHFACIGDMYLFGCVLERFLSDSASIGTYTRVELEDALTGTVFKWPPRIGQQPLL
jgi:type VI secretion system protein ImpG